MEFNLDLVKKIYEKSEVEEDRAEEESFNKLIEETKKNIIIQAEKGILRYKVELESEAAERLVPIFKELNFEVGICQSGTHGDMRILTISW